MATACTDSLALGRAAGAGWASSATPAEVDRIRREFSLEDYRGAGPLDIIRDASPSAFGAEGDLLFVIWPDDESLDRAGIVEFWGQWTDEDPPSAEFLAGFVLGAAPDLQ